MNPRQLLERFQLEPKLSLGQNFLHDPNALDKIVASAEVQPGDVVLEIGAGTGALTDALLRAGADLVSVEIDQRLEPILSERFAGVGGVRFVWGDILEHDPAALVGERPYAVVANVPYYITSAIIRHLLEARLQPRRIVLTVQREVADRITAKPGDMSLLAVSVQYYGTPKLVAKLPPAVFYPRPDVDSAVLRIDVLERPRIDVPAEAFFRVVRAGFAQRRKQLKNSIGDTLQLSPAQTVALFSQAQIDPRRRAETLSLAEWGALAAAYLTIRDGA